MFSKTKSANKKTPQIVKGMNKKKGASVTNVELSNLSQDKNCVICIGSSGSGKSTLISSTLDVDNVKQSNQSGLFEQYHNPSNSDEVWIETHIKWEENKLDTEQVCDDILDYLEKQDIHKLKGIIWTVIPNYIARDMQLHRQAEVIDMFMRKRVWSNVLIVCKESNKPERDGLGAIKASEMLGAEIKPEAVGIRLDTTSKLSKSKEDIMSPDQVKTLIKTKINEFTNAITIFSHRSRKSSSSDQLADETLVYEVGDSGKVKYFLGLPPIVLPKPF